MEMTTNDYKTVTEDEMNEEDNLKWFDYLFQLKKGVYARPNGEADIHIVFLVNTILPQHRKKIKKKDLANYVRSNTNTKIIINKNNGNIKLVATKQIDMDDEILLDYKAPLIHAHIREEQRKITESNSKALFNQSPPKSATTKQILQNQNNRSFVYERFV